jgi:hypothetical protein
MGACGSNKARKKDKIGGGDNNTPGKGKIKIIDGNPINDKKGEEESSKLRNPRKENFEQREYNYELKDLIKNKEVKDKISSNSTILELLNKCNFRSNCDFIIEFENNYKIGYDRINERFGDLMEEVFKNNIPNNIIMSYKYLGLDIPEEDIKKEYIDSNQIIGSAILDNPELFTIITYERNNNKITPFYYKRNENEELIKFNLFTAFCNANGCLYFSGGENDQTYDPDKTVAKYNDFFYIDLKELNENDNKIVIRELPNLNEPRTWHSMIYVPKKYIFIVGGSNTKAVELYNMETKELTKDSELNENRSECSLCLVNNTYLYAFYGFLIHQEYNKTIERCNLLKEKREWENVDYNNTIENSEINFKISFFGISYFNNNEILLIGGDDDGNGKHYDYIYKIGENGERDEIKEFNCNLIDSNNVFRDKSFMLIDYNKSVNIPLIVGEEIRIFILDTNTGDITIQNYNNSSK